jgi:D-glycerate 3-kinase
VIDLREAILRAQPALQQRILQLELHLDEAFIERCVGELALLVLRRAGAAGGCPIVGLSGAQGTGKSTLAWLLCDLLCHGFGKRAVVVSLDDYYLSRAERATLAAQVHPLLVTRGVPGTHALAELHAALRQLRTLGTGESCSLLRFDKASDDRSPESRVCTGPFDLILFEGWCVGARAESADALLEPVNELESIEDPDATFRGFVNTQLAGAYAALWRELDVLVYLAAPDIQAVRTFRAQQESALRSIAAPGSRGLMDEPRLRRFIMHFERVTLQMLRTASSDADAVVELDAARHWRLNVRSV